MNEVPRENVVPLLSDQHQERDSSAHNHIPLACVVPDFLVVGYRDPSTLADLADPLHVRRGRPEVIVMSFDA
jgi:hypothetical protein